MNIMANPSQDGNMGTWQSDSAPFLCWLGFYSHAECIMTRFCLDIHVFLGWRKANIHYVTVLAFVMWQSNDWCQLILWDRNRYQLLLVVTIVPSCFPSPPSGFFLAVGLSGMVWLLEECRKWTQTNLKLLYFTEGNRVSRVRRNDDVIEITIWKNSVPRCAMQLCSCA